MYAGEISVQVCGGRLEGLDRVGLGQGRAVALWLCDGLVYPQCVVNVISLCVEFPEVCHCVVTALGVHSFMLFLLLPGPI